MTAAERALLALLCVASASMSGCGQSGQLENPLLPELPGSLRTPEFGPMDSTFTDSELRAAAYSSYAGPPGFYRDGGGYYVNTVSIHPSCCREPVWRELSTEDESQARAWADSSVAYGTRVPALAPGPALVTTRYFEFPSTVPAPYGVAMRVHRRSYLDRDMVDLFMSDSLAGVLNARPIDSETVRGLAEYLWFKSYRETGGFRVLSSFSRDHGEVVSHRIFYVATVYGDFGLSDEISLVREDYLVAKATGLIVLRRSVERTIGGKHHMEAPRPAPVESRLPMLAARLR